MLVETSPVPAVRIVKYSAPMLVPADDWTWCDELKVTLQTLCEETFGQEAEYREHHWKSRSDDHSGYVGVDIVFAAPAGFDAEMQELARERTEEIMTQAGHPVALSVSSVGRTQSTSRSAFKALWSVRRSSVLCQSMRTDTNSGSG